MMQSRVRTCLWFDGKGGEAARFYVSLIPDSRIEDAFHPDPSAPPLVVNFTLGGAPFQALNGGKHFPFNEAASISVLTQDQAETDRLWAALIADGGAESRCGWLTDRFGLSWQIVPEPATKLFMGPDKARAARAMQALMGMKKIDIAALQSAYEDS